MTRRLIAPLVIAVTLVALASLGAPLLLYVWSSL
jgi:hypothetical protein